MARQLKSQWNTAKCLIPNQQYVKKHQFNLHCLRSTSRTQLEKYITKKYKEVHGALALDFMPLLLEMRGQSNTQAVLGLKPGQYRPMFLEQYLDTPIEQQISTIALQPINRRTIVEVGNFVVTRKGAGLLLFTILGKALATAGFEWMVFTVTPTVEKLMQRLGFDPQYLEAANPQCIKGDVKNWGRYYDSQPKVMAGSLIKTEQVANNNPILMALHDDYREDISAIANALSYHRRLLK